MDTIKYTTYLEAEPVDTKGYIIEASSKGKTPYMVKGTIEVDLDEYIDNRDIRELAKKSAVIDIQKAERLGVKVALGVASKRETAENLKTSQMARLLDLKETLPEDQYENMKRIILGN